MADSAGEGSNGGGSGKPTEHTTEAQAAHAHARAYEHALAYTRARTSVSLAVKASGLLALLLSSVILLGGYVQSLGKKDFLCITAISVIQSFGIFNDWENSIVYLIDFTSAIMEKFIRLITDPNPKNIIIIIVGYPFMIGISCVKTIFLYGPFACAAISSWRISKINHGNRDGTDSMANMMVALNLFYALVIFQGAVFMVLFLNAIIGEGIMASLLLAQEQLPLPEGQGKEAIIKYLYHVSVKCRKDPLSIRGMDLIKYAVELLDSESQVDYLYGARLLSSFIKKKMGKDVRSLLLPSRKKIQKLIESLRISSSLDETCVEFRSLNPLNILFPQPSRCLYVMSNLDDNTEIRELAATIVADLAGHIDLTKYPESMTYISSLLQEDTTQTYWNSKQVTFTKCPDPMRPSIEPLTEEEKRRQDFEETTLQRLIIERRQWTLMREQKRMMIRKERRPQNKDGDARYKLILQGVIILDRLASNNENCRLICSHPGLLPKITAPVYSGGLIQDITIKAWSDIVTRSLKLLHKLIRAPGSTSRSLRHAISTNDQALNNLKSVLNLGSEAGQELQLTAMEILTELALDQSVNFAREIKKILIKKQLHVFLDDGDAEESATTAGRTLVSLSTNSESNCALIMTTQNDVIDRLTELFEAKNNITQRIIVAEIMENLCAYCDVDKQHMKEILLPKVLKEIMSKKELQQRIFFAGQNNSASRDEENQRYSEPEKCTCWYHYYRHSLIRKFHQKIRKWVKGHQEISSTADQNKLSDQQSEEQEAILSLTLVISNKLNSADDFDYAIDNTIGREAFVDKLKSILDDNCEATPDSLRIVKLCGQIAESTMLCQQYQQYAEHYRNKGFESSLSKASETMSRLESCMLFLGDFGLKKDSQAAHFRHSVKT
ncbi:unnamed protein product [Urochloa decumbens]|uniref:Uncharacterized protein n=1 Tax=Urochloa decumbens TaxID=240449 RepID=A0ABC9BNY9_9POAL